MEELLANAEDFYQALGLPYRVVNIVSGGFGGGEGGGMCECVFWGGGGMCSCTRAQVWVTP